MVKKERTALERYSILKRWDSRKEFIKYKKWLKKQKPLEF